jgi:uncharacterized repeat protein (TIGR04076 family)
VYKEGDVIYIDDFKIDMINTKKVCIHAFAVLNHYLTAFRKFSFKELGLSNIETKGYLCCPDPGPPFTPGGHVIFEIQKE